MATQTLAAADAILKNAYRGTLVELLNQKTYAIDQFEKANANDLGSFTGRQLVFAVHTSRNRGRGATTDGGSLPVAGTQGTLDGLVPIRYFYAGIELTDPVIEQTKTDEGAFVRALELEMTGAFKDLRKDVSRMVYGTGDGLLASCTTTQATINTFAVDSGQFIAVGDPVDVVVRSSGATSTGAVNRTVTAVTYTGTASSATQANANVTISGAAISVDNTFGVYVSGDRSNESDGLRNITNTGRTLFGINSSTNPIWDGNVKDGLNANPSEDLFMQISQTAMQRSGSEPIDVFLTTFGIQRRLANTYASQKRWNDDNTVRMNGGYSSIMVSAGGGPTPVVADVDCPNGFAFAINKSSFAWAELNPIDWLESPTGNGGILFLKDSATATQKVATWQGWARWYATLVNIAPLRNGQIKNLNDDIPIVRQ